MNKTELDSIFSMNREERRKLLINEKRDATWQAFAELNGLINISELARRYFKKSQGWLSQRIRNNMIRGKRMLFKTEEYATLATSLRDIARRLNEYADEIDAAAPDKPQCQ